MNVTEPRPDQPTHESVEPTAPPPQAGPPPPLAGPAVQPAGPTTGWRQVTTGDPRRKLPALACVLSLMPGLGQVYVGYYKLGFIHMLVFGSTVAFLANQIIPELTPLAGIFLAFFYLYNLVDGWRRASFYNQALAGVDGMDLPAEMSLPAPGGSIAGGGILIIVGLILFSNTALGFSLEWLEQWWPAAPVLFGAWLLFRGIQEKAKAE